MPKKIAVIGGGFAGTMVIRQLIDHGFQGDIVRFHAPTSLTRGPAYQENASPLLLNVRSANMSAFPDDPSHFVRFLEQNYSLHADPMQFVSRSIYGEYLEFIWAETLTLSQQKNIKLILRSDSDIEWEEFDSIVLATGNELPRVPAETKEDKTWQSPIYQGNPWQLQLAEIDYQLPIFILGNGLTMVDTVLQLRNKGFQQKIIALSRHGYHMLAHAKEDAIHSIEKPIEKTDLYALLSYFNRKRKEMAFADFLPFVDAYRPYFPIWWQGFTSEEKNDFLKHLRHIWGTIRHRIPEEIFLKIEQERTSTKLEVCSGKMIEFQNKGTHAEIRYTSNGIEKTERFACLINCTGPESDIHHMKNQVLNELMRKKWIQSDEINQGIKIIPNQLKAVGYAPMNMYALGNLCKGTFWESTAIREIRSQAKLIAKSILAIE